MPRFTKVTPAINSRRSRTRDGSDHRGRKGRRRHRRRHRRDWTRD